MGAIKIHILYPIQDSAWGGGNQFLKSLRNWLRAEDLYEETPEKADVIIFNSNPDSLYGLLDKAIQLKNDLHKVIVNRVDGPINIHRQFGQYIDNANSVFTKCCEGTIYQSDWSKGESIKLGIDNSKNTVIINAPDKFIFKNNKCPSITSSKIKIIATSWSINNNKGFDFYEWLDNNLDFNKYEFVFIGNCPSDFKNITLLNSMDSAKLADKLNECHIYLTASRKDACSNSLIEAMHCGLPAIAFNDGGHPEIVGQGGELFDDPEQIPELIDRIVANYEEYRSKICLPSIDEVGKKYHEFCQRVFDNIQNGGKKLKKIRYYHRVKIKGWLEFHSLRKKYQR